MNDLRTAAPFFVLRTPLLSTRALSGWSDGLSAPGALGAPVEILDRALSADRELLRRRLVALVADEQFADALTLASPDLADAVENWRHAPERREHRSAERSLILFFGRCASRPDLSGLAGTYTVGQFGSEPKLDVAGREGIVARARIDPGLLAAAVRGAAAAAADAGTLLVRANPAIYRVGDRLRVAARLPGRNSHQIVALRSTEAIESTLTAASEGAKVRHLVDALARGGMDAYAARQLVDRLLARELLIAVDRITVTGPEPTVQALAALRATPGAERAAHAVGEAAGVLARASRFDRATIEAVRLAVEPAATAVSPRFCVQVNSARPGEVRLDSAVRAEMWRAAQLLARLGQPPRARVLIRFCEDFERRFGTRSVPLLAAVDPDYGVRLDESTKAGPAPTGARSARQQVLLELIARGSRERDGIVGLEPDLIERLSPEHGRSLPSSFALIVRLLARDARAVASGDYQLVEPLVTGPSGARMLGRLCDGDPELEELVRCHLRREEAAEPELIFADLTAIAESSAGLNVGHRPVLRDWEIESGGPAGAEPGHRLELSDLLIGIEADQVVLRERASGRRVVPSPTSAVNYDRISLPAARLLAYLGAEGTTAPAHWCWDEFERAPHLPRVVHGRTILSLRRWNLPYAELEQLHPPLTAGGFRELHALLRRHGIPRLARLDHPVRPIAVDFENVMSVEAALGKLGHADPIGVVEAPDLEQSPVRAPDGPHAHTLVVPFAAAPVRRIVDHTVRRARPVPEAGRRFAPGSEWLFANLYGPPALAERMLLEHVRPLIGELSRSSVIDLWFFVRYSDPTPHLRLRLHGDPAALQRDALVALTRRTAAALDAGMLHRLSLDTYEREVERYGGLEGVELMERAASADSEAVLDILAIPATRAERRRLTVASLAALYADAGLDLQSRRECAAGLRGSIAGRHSKPLSRMLSADERSERPQVLALLRALDTDGDEPWLEPLRRRSAALRPVLARWRKLEREERLETSFESAIRALGHMCVNRLLRDGTGFDELRVHDALARFYASELARDRGRRPAAKR